MLKNILFAVVSLFAFGAFASPASDAMSQVLGRPLTAEELQNVAKIEEAVAQKQAEAQLVLADYTQDQDTTVWMGCLTVKGGVILAATQQLACIGTDGIYTITKDVAQLVPTDNFILSAEAGIVGARMSVKKEAYSRLANFEILNEPVDTIGIDGAFLGGAQVILFASQNVSLQLVGVVGGLGGGLSLEQNGDVPREAFDGSTLNIKKFNLF